MKAIKIIGGIVLALVAVLAIVVFIGLKNLNSLVKSAIESVGSDVVKTAVKVDHVNIELMEGRGEIDGIHIKNPTGYRIENAASFGNITLHIDPASLTNDVIVVKQLSIDSAQLIAEHKDLIDINLQELYKNISAGGQPGKEPAPTTARPDIRFMLEKVSFTNMSLDLVSEKYGQRDFAMKDIHLTNLGNKQEGLTAEQLTNALLTPVIDAARKRASREIEDLAKDKLKDTLKEKLSDEDKEKLNSIKSWLDK
jgi:hypothetical protein